MKDNNLRYTLITGASTGLGKGFAIECAQRKMNLILLSLPNENLDDLCVELSSNYGIQVAYRETDLTVRESVEELADWIKENFSVNMIINNAGIGGTHVFVDTCIDYLDNIIQLNMRAMTLFTRLLLPELQKHSKAYILNVSSLAAFSPVPYKTIYPASKAFIYHFTRGLRAELKGSNINVSVLNPGPIMTNHDVSKRINGQTQYIKLSIMSPDKIAQIAIKKLLKGKPVIIPGFMNRFSFCMIKMTPIWFRINVGTSIFKRDLKRKLSHESADNRG